MKDSDLFTRHDAEMALVDKGQSSKRYHFGELWEVNYPEIREAFDEYTPKIVRCGDCKWRFESPCPMFDGNTVPDDNWFCANGERD